MTEALVCKAGKVKRELGGNSRQKNSKGLEKGDGNGNTCRALIGSGLMGSRVKSSK